LLLFILLLLSCRKQEPAPPVVSPYTYFQRTGLVPVQPVRLFTRAGEVPNSALAQAYAGEFSDYFYPSYQAMDPYLQRFSRVNADSMLNVSAAPVFELKRVPGGAYDRYKSKYHEIYNDTNSLVLHMGLYKHYEVVTTPLGYTYYDLESPSYVLRQAGDSLAFPMIRFITISRGNYIVSFGADKLNNVFNPASVSKLGPQDTLVVQQLELIMKKAPG
jgi:hypothetical protein